MQQKAIIIGAGPAGLTAAYELLTRTDITPIVLEKSGEIGGISRTTNYKGNRMDMGPHRFFSKSDRVMDWWLRMMPLEGQAAGQTTISYQNKSREIPSGGPAPKDPNKVMLVIQRLTRIYFLRQFFAYPIQLSIDTLKTLGLIRTLRILFSFLYIRVFPRTPEKSLEDFIVNKFGKQLYLLFFKDYTQKVWGIPPSEISAEWGAQRIKGVSLSKAIAGAVKSIRAGKKRGTDLSQKEIETSLIEQFLYPKYGPGSLWEEVARQIEAMGGKVYLHQDVQKIYHQDEKIQSILTINSQTGQTGAWEGDYFFSTMPVKELIADMGKQVPAEVQRIAAGLQYRDFINVGILLKEMRTANNKKLELKDNWIYIQEKDVKVGRLMIYNNWGDGMIRDKNTIWIGMEYFCNTSDELWAQSDTAIQRLAIKELEQMDLARTEDVLDSTVRRMEKTYPAYFGTYEQFDQIKAYTDQFSNLFLVGRNGMHKYNNADHSMLTAMVAVDNIIAGITTKESLWSINTEQEYHEEKKEVSSPAPAVASRKGGLAPLRQFLSHNTLQRNLILFGIIASIIQLCVFKYFYPDPSFINGDSYTYIQEAHNNSLIGTYPIGYPRFLRLFSVFTTSPTALIAFQYLLIQASLSFFLFTLYSILKPSRGIQIASFIFLLCNPLILFVANFVSSDPFFLAISLCWFSLLLLSMASSQPRWLWWQVAVLFLAFIVRYNALYYPAIATIAILLSRHKPRRKGLAIAASYLVIGLFIWQSSNHYKERFGIREFTPFTGWQLANNALYAYRFIDSNQVKPVPSQFKAIDKEVRHYFDTSRNVLTHPIELLYANTYYMWDPRSPLLTFQHAQFKKDSAKTEFDQWARMAPLYQQYGSWLVQHYPGAYAQHYLWINFLKYYAPPSEFLEVYNMGLDTIGAWGQLWFKYKNKQIRHHFKDKTHTTLTYFPEIVGIVNLLFFLGLLSTWVLGSVTDPVQKRALWLFAANWLLNMVFSVVASPVALRYQVFPFVLAAAMDFVLFAQIARLAFTRNIQPKQKWTGQPA